MPLGKASRAKLSEGVWGTRSGTSPSAGVPRVGRRIRTPVFPSCLAQNACTGPAYTTAVRAGPFSWHGNVTLNHLQKPVAAVARVPGRTGFDPIMPRPRH